MPQVVEVHRKVRDNVGDMYCNPSRYFNLGDVSSEELLYNKTNLSNKTLVVGGGGLIHKKFSGHIETLISKNPTNTVLWAIGHNFGKRYFEKSQGKVYYPDWIDYCSLVGIRDWIDDYEKYYLPCVSCMHPAFDKTYKVRHDVVYFTHAFKTKFENKEVRPLITNKTTNFNNVIEFLGSSNTVVTDSYHGAYWAQLLGKNVQVASWSVKFNHMKYPPYFLNSINDSYKPVNNSVPGFLQECREYNNNFYQKFLNL